MRSAPVGSRSTPYLSILLLFSWACSLFPGAAEPSATPAPEASATAAEPTPTEAPPTAAATATVVHLDQPEEPPSAMLFLIDVASAGTAAERRTTGGDNFDRNRFERPFTANAMDYRPDLDIVWAGVSADEGWFYFQIQLEAAAGPPAGLFGTYAVEIDLDVDGRGDWWIAVREPESEAWSTEGVRAWSDGNDDVGGDTVVNSDPPPAAGDGYETLAFDQGFGEDPDAAWARWTPGEQPMVVIAVHRTLLSGDGTFLWGVWADDGVDNPAWLDYSDHFSAAEAGSPLKDSGDYPVKALSALDNTCRMYLGFTPTGSEPGICVVTGRVQNCTPHPMMMQPGGRLIPPFFDAGSLVQNVAPGTYSFYDQNVAGEPVVLTASLSPGGIIQVTKDGNGNSYPCP